MGIFISWRSHLKTFELHRVEDETGISGTGIVAQGVVFDDGTCALRWVTAFKSSGIYASMRDVEAVHGHGGKTKVVFTDALTIRSSEDPSAITVAAVQGSDPCPAPSFAPASPPAPDSG